MTIVRSKVRAGAALLYLNLHWSLEISSQRIQNIEDANEGSSAQERFLFHRDLVPGFRSSFFLNICDLLQIPKTGNDIRELWNALLSLPSTWAGTI